MRLQPLLLITLCLSSPSLFAHDYWLQPTGEDYHLHRGHRYSEHQGAKEVPFDPAIITATRCLSASDGSLHSSRVSGSYPPLIKGPCQALLISLDSGYWSQTLTGTRNQPKNELFAVLRSWQALETVKRIESWSPRLTRPLGDGFEIVFQENPFTLSVGDKLRLTTLLDGQPVAGAAVAYHGDARGVSDAEGHINIRIRHTGLQIVSASLERALNTDRADKQIRSSVLMLNLKTESH
jgi:nickel transport protein